MYTEEFLEQYATAAEKLTHKMETAIPFRKSRVANWLGAKQVTARAVVPSTAESGIFIRAWLERPATQNESESLITLKTDKVKDPATLEGRAQPYATEPTVPACYDPRFEPVFGLAISIEEQTPTYEGKLERLEELTGLVQAIQMAEHQRTMGSIPSLHDIKVAGVNA